MPIDENRVYVLTVDSVRSISLIPTTDNASVVIGVEDHHSATIVELTKPEFMELIEAAQKIVAGMEETP